MMFGFQTAIGVCWVIFILYWAISAMRLKPTKVRGQGFIYLRLLGALFVLIIFISFRKFNLIGPFSMKEAGSTLAGFLALVFSITGLIIAILARSALGGNWSTNPEVKKGHELITKGIYSVVRHPIYFGILLMAIGTCIFYQSIIVYAIFVFVFGVFIYKMMLEEALMTKTFPKDYPKYKKRIKALIPYIW